MTNIRTQDFIEIILAEDNIDKDFEEERNGVKIQYIKGPKDIISICVSDEFIPNRTAKAYMRQLGIDDLIISLFPSDD